MSPHLLRLTVIACSVSCTFAYAQTNLRPYSAPSRWNNFNVPRSSGSQLTFQQGAQRIAQEQFETLPAPGAPVPLPVPDPLPRSDSPASPAPLTNDSMIESYGDVMVGSAVGDCCGPNCDLGCCSAPQMCPWYGGADLLFLTMDNHGYRNLVVADATGVSYLNSAAADPTATMGFDAFIGRYFCCGKYGASLGYMLWNPSPERTLVLPGAPGGFQPAFPAWNVLEIDPGTGNDTVYNHFDGAAGFRVQRDMKFQGLEAMVSHFGILGARRSADCCKRPLLRGLFRDRCCTPVGYGGVCGPLTPGCGCCLRVTTSCGVRWFQVDDDFQFAANINGTADYQADDLYYDIDTQNNLYGYQFGSQLNYCVHCRWNFSVGAKFGIYANDVSYRQRIGTQTVVANRVGAAADRVDTEDSDVVLSTLGELDLGVGYRLSCCCTVRGGYRLMGLTGIATATDQFASDYNALGPSWYVSADDSLLLHGGYFGLTFNW